MTIHSTDQKLGLAILEVRDTFFRCHELGDHVMSPGTLGLIENGDTFRGHIVIANEGIAVFMDDLDEG